jgi:hypothetical protein
MLYGVVVTCHALQVTFSETSLRMCLPLDDSRELSEAEKEPFRWLRGDSEWQRNLKKSWFDSYVAPLVVIFTKRDGAVAKVAKDNSSSLDAKSSRASKKQARTKADAEVTEQVKEREEELNQLG